MAIWVDEITKGDGDGERVEILGLRYPNPNLAWHDDISCAGKELCSVSMS
jgi:hypothetical protein